MHFTMTNQDGVKSITLIGAETQVIPDSHPKFKELEQRLFSEENWTEDGIWGLVNETENKLKDVISLSERVSYRHGSILFDGDLVDNSLTRHILRMFDADDENVTHFVRFLENIALNPSKTSRLQLFRWLDERDFAITEDGCFLGYKGVNDDWDNLSINSGGAFVNGRWVEGRVPNKKGSVIEMPRSEVNPERSIGCSTGLHVGTYEYAKNFGAKTLLVKVNPRDVVSVPSDHSDQKLRCCRYVVMDDPEGKVHVDFVTTPTWTPKEDDVFKEYDAPGEWDDDPDDPDEESQIEYCATCGDAVFEDDLDGNEECSDCASITYCGYCGNEFPEEELRDVRDQLSCRECAWDVL